MGVEKLFNSLERTESIQKDGIHIGFKKKIQTDYFYDDFNSTVYTTASEIERELNYLLYAIILNSDNNRSITLPLDEKAIEYALKWKFDVSTPSNLTIESYKKYFTSDLIDIVALERIESYMIFKCTQLIEPDLLKLYMVSMDGVPQMAKEREQKKRRFNGSIINELKKRIYAKCELNGSNSAHPLRKIYEMHKISYDRGKIISWTSFMKSIELLLTSDKFLEKLKSACPNLEKVIVSHQNIYGEGEKKIMEHILETKLVGKYTFFSPDADVIMLGIIAQNTLNNGSEFYILRHNQQSEEYDVININILCDNLFKYVEQKVGISKVGISKADAYKVDITKQSVSNDIAFIFTLFGNDFIPRVESIDVRNNIETLLDLYCSVIKKAQKKCLIYKSTTSNFQRINYYNFAELIKVIAQIEHSLLNETYLANKYRNYGFLKRELKVTKLLPVVQSYVVLANKLFNSLREVNKNNLDLTYTYIYIDNIVESYSKNLEFIEQFLIFEGVNFKRDSDGNVIDLIEKFKYQLIKIITYFSTNKKEIRGKHIFQHYDQFDISSSYHKRNIMESFHHPLMEITEYDIECYKLDRKIGEYEYKLNATDFNLGAVKITYDQNNNYVIQYLSKHNNIIDYYKIFFDISYEIKELVIKDNTKKKVIIFDDVKMTQLVEDYIKGLFWVFDGYFNKNNSTQNSNHVSTWIYPHHRSPLLYQVKEVLFKFASLGPKEFVEKMNSLYNEVTSSKLYIVPRNQFMNKLEHYLYVTPYPYNKHNNDLPEKYKKFVEENKDIFPDLSIISDQIWNNTDNSHLIDCKRISYVNKCNLLCVRFVSFDEFMSRLLCLRDRDIDVDVDVDVNADMITTTQNVNNVNNVNNIKPFEKIFNTDVVNITVNTTDNTTVNTTVNTTDNTTDTDVTTISANNNTNTTNNTNTDIVATTTVVDDRTTADRTTTVSTTTDRTTTVRTTDTTEIINNIKFETTIVQYRKYLRDLYKKKGNKIYKQMYKSLEI